MLLSTLVGLVCLGVGAASTAASTTGRTVRAVPLAPDHILAGTLSFPPDTAYCRAHLHRSCYQPAQFQRAYDLKPLFDRGVNGAGTTIVIVDAFGSPTIAADLNHFDQTFGLAAPPSLQVIEPAGAVPAFPADPFGAADRSGWAVETTLDVEYAHVMAPGAKILVVATPASETEGVQGFPEIVQAENYVVDHRLGDVISQSFGATEETFPSKQSLLDLRSAFINAQQHNVTVLGASGDMGSTDLLPDTSCCYPFRVNSWPSSDPLVTSVGGTQLHLDEAGNRLAPDNVWNDGFAAGGGGQSKVFARPAFQDRVKNVVGEARGTPDVSMSAAVDGAAVFYYSFCDYSRNDPGTGKPPLCGPQWHLVGGTSEASPLFAGIVALTDQAAGHRVGWLNPTLYARAGRDLQGGVVDVTLGNNMLAPFCTANCGTPSEVDTTVPGFDALPGYDLASGLGTIDAARFVGAASRAQITGTVVACSPGGVGVGQPTTCTAKVTGSTTPIGSVSFAGNSDGAFGPSTCTLAVVDAAHSACSVTYTPETVGSGLHKVYANYSGDAFNAPSHNSASVTVHRGTSTTAVRCAPTTVAKGAPTTCTATVTGAPGSAPPTGRVAFAGNSSGSLSAPLCTLAAAGGSSASCSVRYTPTAVGSGSHKIYADYPGDINLAQSHGSSTIAVTP